MPKIVQSMLKVFGRQPSKSKLDGVDSNSGNGGSRRQKAQKRRKSVLDADSFVFLPGDKAANYWGQILNDENFPVSQLSADYSVRAAEMRRRKTHTGGLRRSDENCGVQEVNVIKPRSRSKSSANHLQVPGEGGSPLHNGFVYDRRLSGTLVKRISTDEVEDATVIHDYAFCVSGRERWSQDLSGQYIYDKLVRPPVKTSTPAKTSTPVQWNYPSNDAPRESKETPKRRQDSPRHSSHVRAQSAFIIDEREIDRSSKCQERLRWASRQTLTSHGYCDLEPPTPRSEYAMPVDSIDWEQIRLRTWRGKKIALLSVTIREGDLEGVWLVEVITCYRHRVLST